MPAKGTPRRYGNVATALHWTIAAAVFATLPLGFLAAHAPDTHSAKILLRLHVPLGLLILLLTLARAAWWLVDRRPIAIGGQPRWQIGVAHGLHALLYIVPLLLGASGIGLMIQSGAAPVLFTGASTALPRFADLAPMAAHWLAAFTLTALLGAHILAACYHQFYRRDRLLSRMSIGSAKGTE